MAYPWPNYDPTREALLQPERSHPYGLHRLGDGWPIEAVCAEFSRLAYFRFEGPDGERLLSEALSKAGFGAPARFNSKAPLFGNPLRRAMQTLRSRDAQAFGATSLDGEVAILAYRGTQADSPGDLITDLWAFKASALGGKVHKGFLLAYQSLEDKIAPWLASVRGKRLIVTGHSLGAAMATLMASRHRQAELVTFGCPLTGDQDFADAFGRDSIRYVDCADKVTTVPYGFLGYVHFGELRYIDRDGVVQLSATADAIKQDRAQAKAEYRRTHARSAGNLKVRAFADHAPVNYVSAVSEMRPSAHGPALTTASPAG